jgi:hypothetical protein
MATQELNIKLNLLDNASAALNKVQKTIGDMGKSIDQFGRAMNQMGTRLTLIGGTITGAFTLALKNVATYVPSVNQAFWEMSNVMRNVQIIIAESVTPTLQLFVNILANLAQKFRDMNPELRTAILNWTLIGGAITFVVGILLKLAGTIVSIVGKLISFAAALGPIPVILLGIVAALAAMIVFWERVRDVVLPIINAIEVAVRAMGDTVLRVFRFIIDALEGYITTMRDLMLKLRDIAANTPNLFADKTVAMMNTNIEKLTEFSVKLKSTSRTMSNTIEESGKKLSESWNNFTSGKPGDWATNVDTMMTGLHDKFKNFFESIKALGRSSGGDMKKWVYDWTSYAKQVVGQLAQQMTQSLGNFFYNALTGQITDAKEMFAEFGRSILQILTQVLAKVLLVNTLGGFMLPGGLGMLGAYFHSGGVVRAHSGMAIGSDEVPIIAQSGEGILSRRGMAALGGEGALNSLNRGNRQGGGQTVYITNVIHAWDAKDVSRNIKTLESSMVERLRKNSDFRLAMKQYA